MQKIQKKKNCKEIREFIKKLFYSDKHFNFLMGTSMQAAGCRLQAVAWRTGVHYFKVQVTKMLILQLKYNETNTCYDLKSSLTE